MAPIPSSPKEVRGSIALRPRTTRPDHADRCRRHAGGGRRDRWLAAGVVCAADRPDRAIMHAFVSMWQSANGHRGQRARVIRGGVWNRRFGLGSDTLTCLGDQPPGCRIHRLVEHALNQRVGDREHAEGSAV